MVDLDFSQSTIHHVMLLAIIEVIELYGLSVGLDPFNTEDVGIWRFTLQLSRYRGGYFNWLLLLLLSYCFIFLVVIRVLQLMVQLNLRRTMIGEGTQEIGNIQDEI